MVTETVWRGSPRTRDLLRDAGQGARAQIATTFTLVLVLATVCFSILVTTGQSAASEARIVEQIDSAGTRLIALSDDGGNARILPDAPATLAILSDVSWTFGLGEAVDVTNPLLRDGRVASRALVGPLPADVALIQGRIPQVGEAIIGSTATATLHLAEGLGTVQVLDATRDPVGVVGVFDATGPLEHLSNTVLVATAPADMESLRYVYVMATDVTTVNRLEEVLATSTPADNPAALTIETPSGAIALRDVIAGRLGATSRQLMAVVMGVGAVIIAVTMLSATVSRRRDFGRRRALGATRSALVAALLAQTLIGAVTGIVLGTSAGLIVLHYTTASLPSWQFTAGVAGLTLLLTLLAATPIATHAAHRDPLLILRVP
jgi:putative ABC transport system permease protein